MYFLKFMPIIALLTTLSVAQSSTRGYSMATHELVNGRIEVRLINTGSSAIDVLHTSYKCPQYSVSFDKDPLLHNEASHLILPGATYIVKVAGITKDCNLKESAVLYADGSSDGDPAAIAAIYAQRAGVLQELLEVYKTIVSAAAGGLDEGALTKYISDRETAIDSLQLTRGGHVGHLAVLETLNQNLSLGPPPLHVGPTTAPQAIPDIVTRAQSEVTALDVWHLRLNAVTKPN
jgi:hypothetical protein